MRGQRVHRLVFWENRDLNVLGDLCPLTLWRGTTVTISKTTWRAASVIAITAWGAAFTTWAESAATGWTWAARAITARRRSATAATIAKTTATPAPIITASALRTVLRVSVALLDLVFFSEFAHPCRHQFQIGKVHQSAVGLRLVVGAGFGFGHTVSLEGAATMPGIAVVASFVRVAFSWPEAM
jgi:hypothetical protein